MGKLTISQCMILITNTKCRDENILDLYFGYGIISTYIMDLHTNDTTYKSYVGICISPTRCYELKGYEYYVTTGYRIWMLTVKGNFISDIQIQASQSFKEIHKIQYVMPSSYVVTHLIQIIQDDGFSIISRSQ